MSLRERLLAAALGLAVALLVTFGIWQQTRYEDARQAVQGWIDMERQADREGEEPSPLIRQATPELRRALAEGEFATALKRLAVLREEQRTSDDPEIRGESVPLDVLWPPKSQERERARQALRLLVTKQEQGYDMTAARDALLRVADAARTGKKDEALAAFAEAEARVKDAPLRPGFKLARQEGPEPPGPGAGRRLDPRVMRNLQLLQAALPQVREQATPEMRPLLDRLPAFLKELEAAYVAGKDLAPLLPMVRDLMAAIQSNDADSVERVLRDARAALASAKTLAPAPSGTTPPGGGKAQPAPGAVAPGSMRLPAGPAGGMTPEGILLVLDGLRTMPEPEYRKQRGRIAGMLSILGARMGTDRGPGLSTIGGEELGLGIDRTGRIRRLLVRGHDLGSGVRGAGLALQSADREAPLEVPTAASKQGLTGRVEGAAGALTADYRVTGDAIAVRIQARRSTTEAPGAILLRLPVRAGGWKWQAAGRSEVVAVDGHYELANGGAGELQPAMLLGPDGIRLSVKAPTAASVSLDPVKCHLVVRHALPAGTDRLDATVRLELAPPGDARVQ